MKIVKVKILKASLPTYWYAKMIGREFNCIEFGKFDNIISYKVIFEGQFDSHQATSYINSDDIVVLEEFEGEIKEVVTVEVIRSDRT